VATFRESLQNTIREGFCVILQNEAAFEDFLGQNTLTLTRPYYNIGRAGYNLFCNTTPPAPPPLQYPQGQCPVGYRVTLNYEYRLNSSNWIADQIVVECGAPVNTIYGPIGSLERVVDGNGVYYALNAYDSAGQPRQWGLTSIFNVTTGDIRNGSISVDRCDSQPDNCGQGTVTPPPPDYNNVTTVINYIDASNTEITIPVNLVYLRPTFNNDFDVVVPVRILIDDPQINVPVRVTGTLNLSTGAINFNIGGNGGYDDRGGDRNRDPISIDLPELPPPDSDSPDEEEPDDTLQENRIIGVLVTVTSPGRRAGIISSGGDVPDIYVPAICWILFRVRAAGNSTGYLKHIPVNLLREFIPCPWEGGAIAVRVANPNGASLSVVPLYSRIDTAQEFVST